MTRSHAVGYPHHPTAVPASHQSGQQSSPTARRFARRALLHVRVLQNHLLILLELLPTDVALMMVVQQHAPCRHRPPVTAGFLARPSTTWMRWLVLPKAYAPAYMGFCRTCSTV